MIDEEEIQRRAAATAALIERSRYSMTVMAKALAEAMAKLAADYQRQRSIKEAVERIARLSSTDSQCAT